jgi:hypothetical protein
MTEENRRKAEEQVRKRIAYMKRLVDTQIPRQKWKWINSGLRGEECIRACCDYWCAYMFRYWRMKKEAEELWPLL